MDKPAAPTYYFLIMASDRLQRRIEHLLDQIDQEADQQNWQIVYDLADEVIGLAPDNSDAFGCGRAKAILDSESQTCVAYALNRMHSTNSSVPGLKEVEDARSAVWLREPNQSEKTI